MSHYSFKGQFKRLDLSEVQSQLKDKALGPYFFRLDDYTNEAEIQELRNMLQENRFRARLHRYDDKKFLVLTQNDF